MNSHPVLTEFIAFRQSKTLNRFRQEMIALDTRARFHIPPGLIAPERLHGVVNGRQGQPQCICFVDQEPDITAQQGLRGAVVITTETLAPQLAHALTVITADPRALFIDYLNQQLANDAFEPLSSTAALPVGIAASASIHERAVIEDGVAIAEGVIIGAGAVIKRGSVIGAHAIIRENTVIGCPGIALYRCRDERVLRFPHLAGVHVGDRTEIGANVVIPRGALHSTRIGQDCVIGNLCNIGHGACIGDRVWMSVGSLIGGNCRIGHRVTIGMGATVRDNIDIGDDATIGMGSVVTKSTEPGTSLFGNPAKRMPSLSAGPAR